MTKNMIETTADGSIVLPTYSHATDGWKFTEAKDGILIFQPENKMLGMESSSDGTIHTRTRN